MVKTDVDSMLARYREYSARCEYLQQDIRENERLIDVMRDSLVEDLISITPKLTGMPIPSGVSDSTGKIGDMIVSGYENSFIIEAEQEVLRMKQEVAEKLPTVVFVNAWLRALENKERFVVEQKVLGGLSWRQLIYSFKKQFGDMYSQQGLRRIRDTAMCKIYRIAE